MQTFHYEPAALPANSNDRKRVAAYCRVSTLDEDQEMSFETQRQYYADLISKDPNMILVGIYGDQGFSGLQSKQRKEFQRMLADCESGKIDVILVKSISRFSRNTVECISTFDSSSDFLFSIFAALAQEESRSISENMKWAFRRLAEQGIRHVGSNHMLGYDEIDGKLTPNKDAWIVRFIFMEYAAGLSPSVIARRLQEMGAKRMRTEKGYSPSYLFSILKNEAYAGNRLIQKTPPRNYLTKRPDPKEPYESKFIYGDHEGIISPAVWDAVQERLKRNKAEKEKGINRRCTAHFLYGIVFCAECGEPYRRCTVTHVSGRDKVWRCRGRDKGTGCSGPHISEENLIAAIMETTGCKEVNESILSERIEKVLVHHDGIEIVETGVDMGKQNEVL